MFEVPEFDFYLEFYELTSYFVIKFLLYKGYDVIKVVISKSCHSLEKNFNEINVG